MAMACIRFAFAQTYLLAGERPPVYSLDLVLVVLHVIGLILTQFPALITPRSLDLWYVLLQGLLVAPFFVAVPRHVTTLSNWTFVLRVMLGLSARHGGLVVLGNALASVLVMRLLGFNSQSALFTGEVTKLSFLLLAVFSIRRLIFRDARASVELKSRSIELDAVSSLLRGFCDAVVEVDQSLHITENSNQLLTILLRSNPSIAGKSFLELFCLDDQAKVQQCLTTTSTVLDHTHALNARLLDCDGNYVKVELLHVRFVTAAGDSHRTLATDFFFGHRILFLHLYFVAQDKQLVHVCICNAGLVGIREFQDMQEVAVNALPAPAANAMLYDTDAWIFLNSV
eukprot:Skav210260  [mRNA]  locus=scaffold1929:281078:282100:- [translate_table: standard]